MPIVALVALFRPERQRGAYRSYAREVAVATAAILVQQLWRVLLGGYRPEEYYCL